MRTYDPHDTDCRSSEPDAALVVLPLHQHVLRSKEDALQDALVDRHLLLSPDFLFSKRKASLTYTFDRRVSLLRCVVLAEHYPVERLYLALDVRFLRLGSVHLAQDFVEPSLLRLVTLLL